MSELQEHDRAVLEKTRWLIGVDEAGRGALAGPVAAGACVLTRSFFDSMDALRRTEGVRDSKQLDPPERARLVAEMEALRAEGLLDFAVVAGPVSRIETENILGATRWAMGEALESLAGRAGGWRLPAAAEAGPLFASAEAGVPRILVDGRPLKPFPYAHEALVRGDGASLAIAMAGLAAKVFRDRQMERLAVDYPGYGLEKHKGYGTAAHRSAIGRFGPSAVHRRLFLRKILRENAGGTPGYEPESPPSG